MSTYLRADNVPVLTNEAGREDKDFNFKIDKEAEVWGGCSLTWENELFIFGGLHKKTQISRVQSCRLEPIGTLVFEHYFGDCVNVASTKIVLCFNNVDGDITHIANKCRMAPSPTDAFSELKPSQYEHSRARIATDDGEFVNQSLTITFSLQSLLSLLGAFRETTKLNYSMLMKTTGQTLTIIRLIWG